MADFGTLLGKIADVVMGNGDTGRPRVGVLLEGTTGQAPVIKQVEPGSPAHNAGLLQGDRLLSVSATNIPSRTVELRGFHAEQCSGLLKEMFRDATLAGGKIILQVERFQGGAVQVFLAELGKSPQELAKVIARSGLCSRREAVRLILDGRVEVNGAVVKECGTRIGVADTVIVDGNMMIEAGQLTDDQWKAQMSYIAEEAEESKTECDPWKGLKDAVETGQYGAQAPMLIQYGVRPPAQTYTRTGSDLPMPLDSVPRRLHQCFVTVDVDDGVEEGEPARMPDSIALKETTHSIHAWDVLYTEKQAARERLGCCEFQMLNEEKGAKTEGPENTSSRVRRKNRRAQPTPQVVVGQVEQYESLVGFLGRDGGATGGVRAALRVAARAAAPPQVLEPSKVVVKRGGPDKDAVPAFSLKERGMVLETEEHSGLLPACDLDEALEELGGVSRGYPPSRKQSEKEKYRGKEVRRERGPEKQNFPPSFIILEEEESTSTANVRDPPLREESQHNSFFPRSEASEASEALRLSQFPAHTGIRAEEEVDEHTEMRARAQRMTDYSTEKENMQKIAVVAAELRAVFLNARHKKAGTLGDTLAGTLAGTLGDSKVVADRHVVFTPRLPHDGYVLRNASTDKDKDLGLEREGRTYVAEEGRTCDVASATRYGAMLSEAPLYQPPLGDEYEQPGGAPRRYTAVGHGARRSTAGGHGGSGSICEMPWGAPYGHELMLTSPSLVLATIELPAVPDKVPRFSATGEQLVQHSIA